MKYTADFETTSKEPTKVWAWAICSINSPDVILRGETIESFLEQCQKLKSPTVYFHNLKFDVSFVLHHLLTHGFKWKGNSTLCSGNDFTILISAENVFFRCDVYFSKASGKRTKKVTFIDSLKIFPRMGVEDIAKAFELPYKKLKIDYKKHDIDCDVTSDEWLYIKNDVKIVAMALKKMEELGLDKMTIGMSALSDYKNFIGSRNFERYFPKLDFESDAKIRMSYRGGFVHVNPEYRFKDIGNGIRLDINSLYPYVMFSKPLPFGVPLEFKGKYQPSKEYPLFIQNFRCFFRLKPNHVPVVSLKNNFMRNVNQYLESSVNPITGEDEMIDLSLTNMELELFFQHYDVECVEYTGGYMFKSSDKLFKEWIKKWYSVKVEAEKKHNKTLRTIAKLLLNNLYGKFATNPIRENKYPVLNEKNNTVVYELIQYLLTDENGEIIPDEQGNLQYTTKTLTDPVYIPIGTFVTSWARYTTITAVQKIHEDSIKATGHSRYLYSDTDSIHLTGFEIPESIEIDPVMLGKWKVEAYFERARFLQQKRYIEEEFILDDKGNFLKNGYGDYITKYNIVCAGMPERCYKYVNFDNFVIGSKYFGKLSQKNVSGGVILIEDYFTLKE